MMMMMSMMTMNAVIAEKEIGNEIAMLKPERGYNEPK